jgi:hypothetical protein
LQVLPVFLFLGHISPDLDEKNIEILDKKRIQGYTSTITGPKTAVFSGLSSNELEGPGPRSWSGPVSGPKRSLGLDLEALAVLKKKLLSGPDWESTRMAQFLFIYCPRGLRPIIDFTSLST